MKLTERPKHEIIEQLTIIANSLDSKKDSYLISYPYFLAYFKGLSTINLDNLIIGISFTYSWMPTILKSIELDDVEKVICTLNEVKQGKLINEEQLIILKRTFNNSLVGSSKLLHFINPKLYAIWDSKVFRFLYKETPHTYKVERPDLYLKYLEFIKSLTQTSNFEFFYLLMKNKVGYEISEYRALELAFFYGNEEQNFPL